MKFLKALFIIVITVAPTIALADSIFKPYPNDLSITYLSFIFGNVEGTAITGGGFQTLKTVLTSFNMTVMTLGAIIVIYSLLVSTVNTAHDGEMLGREWSSVWIPIRTAMGFALLLPVKGSTSYSVIQVFVMWVVTQGIYAADFLWSQSVASVLSGGTTIPDYSQSSTSAQTLAQSIFTSLVCTKQAAINLDTQPGSLGPTNQKYTFGVSGLSPADICGNVSVSTDPDDSSTHYADAQNQAIVNMIHYLDDTADEYIRQYAASANVTKDSDTANRIQQDITGAANNYMVTLNSAISSYSNDDELNAMLDEMVSVGWIMAGSSFLTLAQTSNEQSGVTINMPNSLKWSDQKEGGSNPAILQYMPDSKAFNNELQDAYNISIPSEIQMGNITQVADFLNKQLGPVQQVFLWPMTFYMKILTSGGLLSGSTTSLTNPVILMMTAGLWITRLVVAGYAVFVTAVSVLGGAAYGVGGSLLGMFGGEAVIGIFNAFLALTGPVFTVLFGVLLTIGISWGFYIPIIPFVIFTSGVIGWIILVIEAMVAAPLMAIGVLHPEGKHTVFGEAHTGIMLIAGIFLRPALMIVGLIAALILSYIIAIIISIGFYPLAIQLAGKTFSIIGLVACMVFYTTLIIVGLNRCFSLIHVLPDKIMRWIGQPGEQSSTDEVGEVKNASGQAEQSIGRVGQAGTSSATSSVQEKINKARKDKERAESNSKDRSTGGGFEASNG